MEYLETIVFLSLGSILFLLNKMLYDYNKFKTKKRSKWAVQKWVNTNIITMIMGIIGGYVILYFADEYLMDNGYLVPYDQLTILSGFIATPILRYVYPVITNGDMWKSFNILNKKDR